MPRGRKPKPTNLKIITGNPGKRKLNKKEPQPGRASRKTPKEFLVNRAEPGKVDNDFLAPNAAEEAAKAFKLYHDELEQMGLLTTVDTALLSAYCLAYGFWKEASAMVNRLGMVTKTSNGNLIQNPFMAIVNKQSAIMVKIASEFGFSPSSRSRLDVSDSTEDDEFLTLMSRKKA